MRHPIQIRGTRDVAQTVKVGLVADIEMIPAHRPRPETPARRQIGVEGLRRLIAIRLQQKNARMIALKIKPIEHIDFRTFVIDGNEIDFADTVSKNAVETAGRHADIFKAFKGEAPVRELLRHAVRICVDAQEQPASFEAERDGSAFGRRRVRGRFLTHKSK
jgi:hypothetical protein